MAAFCGGFKVSYSSAGESVNNLWYEAWPEKGPDAFKARKYGTSLRRVPAAGRAEIGIFYGCRSKSRQKTVDKTIKFRYSMDKECPDFRMIWHESAICFGFGCFFAFSDDCQQKSIA